MKNIFIKDKNKNQESDEIEENTGQKKIIKKIIEMKMKNIIKIKIQKIIIKIIKI